MFNINDKVKLLNDDTVYVVKEIEEEKYKIQYKISSLENNLYRLWADEKDLTLLLK